MKKWRWLTFAIFLAGCGGQYDRALQRLSWFVGWNQVGSSTNYWLTKGSMGLDDRVGLVFGYLSDMNGCLDIANALNEKFPVANYSCRPAN